MKEVDRLFIDRCTFRKNYFQNDLNLLTLSNILVSYFLCFIFLYHYILCLFAYLFIFFQKIFNVFRLHVNHFINSVALRISFANFITPILMIKMKNVFQTSLLFPLLITIRKMFVCFAGKYTPAIFINHVDGGTITLINYSKLCFYIYNTRRTYIVHQAKWLLLYTST